MDPDSHRPITGAWMDYSSVMLAPTVAVRPGRDVIPAPLVAHEARDALDEWVELFNRCYSVAPRTLDEYHDKVERHLTQPGFRAFEVRTGGTVHAIAYGWPAAPQPPDAPFYRMIRASLGTDGLRELLTIRPFEVAELMVAPAARGQGLGRRLLGELCPADTVSWLATRPDGPAADVYRRLGWRRIGGWTQHDGVPLAFFIRLPAR